VDLGPGGRLLDYRLETVVGRGGMSVVYLAEDLRLRRKVAIKLLAPELAEDGRFRERFVRESTLAASIDHPNVIPIYDAAEADGRLYIAMRYVSGTDLKALLRREGALEPLRAVAIVTQLAAALDVAHGRGLVHRDVKPGNVLLEGEEGHVYLTDFGVAKSASFATGLTTAGQRVGTIDYIAPEQIRGAEVDGRADQYSLGCLLYECLTGDVPFRRDTEVAVIYAHLRDKPPAVSDRRPEIPPTTDAVLARALAKKPGARYESCRDLAAAAEAALGHSPTKGRAGVRRPRNHISGSVRKTFLRDLRTRSAVVVAIGLAVVLAFGAALVAVFRDTPSPPASPVKLVGDSVAAIDPASLSVVAEIPVGGRPGGVAVGMGSVWVANGEDNMLLRIDPRSRKVVRTIGLPVQPREVAVGSESVWIASSSGDEVLRVDPESNEVVGTIRLPHGRDMCCGPELAVSGRAVWVNVRGGVWRVDLATNTAVRTRGAGVINIAYGEGGLWFLTAANRIERVDPSTNRVVASIARGRFGEGNFGGGVAAGEGAVWTTPYSGKALWKMDPLSSRFTGSIPLGRPPGGVEFGAGAVWVVGHDGILLRIDPKSDRVTKKIRLGVIPAPAWAPIAVGEGAVWISVMP
jgi:YVTN family beta-propeller protein